MLGKLHLVRIRLGHERFQKLECHVELVSSALSARSTVICAARALLVHHWDLTASDDQRATTAFDALSLS
jgi:hypothetical protein